MRTHDTLATPDGPFVVIEDDGAVVAAGWTDDPAALAARSRLAGGPGTPGTVRAADAVAAYYAGDASRVARVPVAAPGTAFRERVWEALRAIPAGEVRTYGAVAQALGSPGASRAVGAACGANPVALFVPCHRVTGASGSLTGFAWGVDVKRSLLAREAGDS
ncbi:methylated-DNA--[protein]-cysteine S-methyltransferase [Demequina sp. NBRC 110057]|uniref:methylated-DNA--[protein]-cysteine S-methyltransferase n=1 Tax=Demequina sp. NBRC 110057 TaxID=1570346 RepID=UPI0009FFF7DC|nr:methylated-DNA--[protein]-cysteine S-methyltransferase [Demequina sp. NBRC 110057]